MSSVIKNSLSNKRKTFLGEKMTELTPNLYKELLRHNSSQTSYLTQLVDLSTYRQTYLKKAA